MISVSIEFRQKFKPLCLRSNYISKLGMYSVILNIANVMEILYV